MKNCFYLDENDLFPSTPLDEEQMAHADSKLRVSSTQHHSTFIYSLKIVVVMKLELETITAFKFMNKYNVYFSK